MARSRTPRFFSNISWAMRVHARRISSASMIVAAPVGACSVSEGMVRLKSSFQAEITEASRREGVTGAGPPGSAGGVLDMWDAAFPASRDGIKGHEITKNDLEAL